MKNTILLLLLLFPFLIQAQQSHPLGFNEWLNADQRNQQLKEKLNHASAKLLDDSYFLIGDRTDTFNTANSVWVSRDSSQYLYNLLDTTLSSLNHVRNDPDSGWVSDFVTYYYYDANKDDTSETVQSYDEVNEIWVNQTRSTYAYDVNRNVINNTKYNWDIPTTSWVSSIQTLNDYDISANLIKSTLLQWNVSEWDSVLQLVYTYDGNNNRITQVDYQWLPDKTPGTQLTFYYNALDLDTQTVGKYWNGNTFKNSFMDTLVYDSNKNLLSSTRYDWKNSAGDFILTDYQTMYTYDLTNKLTERQDFYGDGASSFFPADRIIYEYDVNDNLTHLLIEIYNSINADFENFQQTFYWYTDFISGIQSSPDYLNDLSVYPNPANQSLVLHLQSVKDENMEMKIFDQAGRLLKSNSYSVKNGDNEYSLDVSAFDSGIYLIELSNSNHQTVVVQRFVKQ